MGTAEEIAAAVWTAGTRTLLVGVAGAPTNRAEEIADAVWTYVTRTLTEEPEPPGGDGNWSPVHQYHVIFG